jgi:hypothetical protein
MPLAAFRECRGVAKTTPHKTRETTEKRGVTTINDE